MSLPTQLRMLSNGIPLRSNSATQHHEKRKTDAMGGRGSLSSAVRRTACPQIAGSGSRPWTAGCGGRGHRNTDERSRRLSILLEPRDPRATNSRPRRTPRSRRDSALSHGLLKPQFLESVADNGDLWVDRVRCSR